MKRNLIIVALALIGVTSCARDEFYIQDYTFVPDNLKIIETSGIRLESYIVQDEVGINIKLPETGTYRVKLQDIDGTTVSQEKISADAGDNILKVYVKSLTNSSYTIRVESETGTEVGRDLFSKI